MLTIVLCCFLSACATPPKPETNLLVLQESQHHCEVIQHLVMDGPGSLNSSEAQEYARAQAIREAQLLGANAIHFEKIYSKVWEGTVLASALSCEEDWIAHSSTQVSWSEGD